MKTKNEKKKNERKNLKYETERYIYMISRNMKQ